MYPHLQQTSLLFLIGWIAVILFALTVMIGELTGALQLPHLENGTPICYISTALALIIGLLSWFYFRIKEVHFIDQRDSMRITDTEY